MSVEDEIHWARGHVERLRVEGSLEASKEHILGFMGHTLAALEELRAQQESFRGPRRVEVDDS